jgi:hypothetical protein
VEVVISPDETNKVHTLSSQIIKAALLLAQPDKRLLKAYLEVKGADQRYKMEPEG